MNIVSLIAMSAVLALTTAASAGIGNSDGDNEGNRNGWVAHSDANGTNLRDVPQGLVISGDNGRVDNGVGNGGENLEGETPNHYGEDAAADDDPN